MLTNVIIAFYLKNPSGVFVFLEGFITFSGLAKVAIFSTNADAENQNFINHKCVCLTLNRHYCQTRISV
jgi:hypothetical protein